MKVKQTILWPIVGTMTAVIGLYFFRGSLPALRRYLRIRRM